MIKKPVYGFISCWKINFTFREKKNELQSECIPFRCPPVPIEKLDLQTSLDHRAALVRRILMLLVADLFGDAQLLFSDLSDTTIHFLLARIPGPQRYLGLLSGGR